MKVIKVFRIVEEDLEHIRYKYIYLYLIWWISAPETVNDTLDR